MYKYNMTIDNEPYMAFFLDHFEATDFLNANNQDGAEVIVHGFTTISSVEEILNDPDLGQTCYAEEMACLFLLGVDECRKRFSKVAEMDDYLKIMGYLD